MIAAIYTIAFLQGFILLVLGGIIVQRWVSDLLSRYIDNRRRRFQPHILNLLINPSGIAPLELGLLPGDRRYIQEVLLEQASQLRGTDSKNMTGVFEGLGMVRKEIERLGSRWWWRRREAAINLGIMQSQEAIGPLIQLVSDSIEEVRLASVRSLGQLNNQQGLRVLLDAMEDGDRWTGSRIEEILVSMGPGIATEIVPRLISSRNLRSRRLYAELCGLLRLPEAIDPLRSMASDNDPRSRVVVAEALGRIGDLSAIANLRVLLGDEDADVRAEAAKALGSLGEVVTLPDLENALGDEIWQVRHNAAVALSQLGNSGREALDTAASSSNEPSQRAAANVIGMRNLGV